jgi:hypothetical protein
MPKHIHTIAVDETLTPIDAWKELVIFGRRLTFSGGKDTWANIPCDGHECRLIEKE